MIDYEMVTKYLLEYYARDSQDIGEKEYTQIWMDFASLPGKIIIHKIRYDNYKMIEGQPTSYDYKDFEDITRRVKSGELPYWKQNGEKE